MIGLLRKLSAWIIAIIMVLGMLPFSCFASPDNGNTDQGAVIREKGFEKIAENKVLVLYADKKSGEFAIEDKRNRFIWWSNPPGRDKDKIAQGVYKMDLASQFNLTYTDYNGDTLKLRNNYVGSVNKNSTKFENLQNGFRITYDFPGEKFSLPMKVILQESYLSVELEIDKIVEEKNFIYSIDLLPYFGAGSMEDQGYIFVPDGSGALIHFNNGKKNVDSYSEQVYGRDQTFVNVMESVKRNSIRLPVYGIKNGDNALMAVLEKGEGVAGVNALVSGMKTGYNNVYCTFDIRRYDGYVLSSDSQAANSIKIFEKGKPKVDTCAVRFYPLQGKDANYSGMARSYRKYLQDEKGLVKRENVKPSLYVDVYGGVRKTKSIFGFPLNIIEPLTTYKETISMMKELKASGVENIVLGYHGWSSDAVDSRIQLSANTVGKLGGKKEYERLVSYTKENNIRFYPQVDFINFNKGKFPFFSIMNSARTISKSAATIFQYKFSTYFKDPEEDVGRLLSPNSINDVVNRFVKSYRRYGIPGVGVDTMASSVYSDYSQRASSGRQQTVNNWVNTLKLLKHEVGGLSAKSANSYAMPYMDIITDIPDDSSHYFIEDEAVPFYAMVVSGMLPYTLSAANFSTDKKAHFLKTIESGALPYYQWTGKDPVIAKETKYDYLYAADYKTWIKSAVEDYRALQDLYAKIQDREIFSHQKIEDEVYETVYKNGVKIIVNYKDKPVAIDGKFIAPKGFMVREGGELK